MSKHLSSSNRKFRNRWTLASDVYDVQRIWLLKREEEEEEEEEEERGGKKKETRNDSSTDSFEKLPQASWLSSFFSFFFSFSSGRAASAARRFGSMRAQMGLCLMKFGPSCTCHFRGISDRRPLHCLEHNLRNWREPTPPSSRFDPPRYISDSTFLVL